MELGVKASNVVRLDGGACVDCEQNKCYGLKG